MFPWAISALGTVNRYFTLFRLLVKIGLMQQMAYRSHFFMMIAGKIIRIGLLFLFFQAVFLRVNRIGQWSYEQVLLLFATFQIIDYLMSVTFHRNLAFQFPMRIRSGELDSRMLFPINLLFLVSFERIDLIDFVSFFPSLAFLGYVLYRLDFAFTFAQAATYAALVVNALVFLYAMVLMIATVSFWTVQSQGVAKIFDSLLKVGRYPLDIFGDFFKTVLIYILPLVLIAHLPSRALLDALSPRSMLFAFGGTTVFLIASVGFWRLGLRNYVSASS
jgi:ABC-2 type transport system permease protein